ncbi:hypothetical protein RRG08_042930 [Elysia crispata]|uniref:Uncharacterized protein n=1 Tax=Elysia crispata TaxID=231223 RepID=A0AAE1E4N6_9GAST|nr:hypothetical protein RRG08_042930 [Elysia crispata]
MRVLHCCGPCESFTAVGRSGSIIGQLVLTDPTYFTISPAAFVAPTFSAPLETIIALSCAHLILSSTPAPHRSLAGEIQFVGAGGLDVGGRNIAHLRKLPEVFGDSLTWHGGPESVRATKGLK